MGEVIPTIGFLVQTTLDPYASHHKLFLVHCKHIESYQLLLDDEVKTIPKQISNEKTLSLFVQD